MYSANLPEDRTCEEVKNSTETLYLCDGVLYRATYYQGDKVYEIVSNEPGEEPQPEAEGAVQVLGLSLTQPMTRGPAVRELQQVLVDTGGVDGVFGGSTETALLWLQYDYELEQTGEVDRPTAELLGFLPPSEPVEGTEEDAASGDATSDLDTTADDAAESEPSEDAAQSTSDESDTSGNASSGVAPSQSMQSDTGTDEADSTADQ